MSMNFATNVLVDASHNFNLQGAPIYYGTCATAAATTTKSVTCANFVLATGALIFVKFTYANTGAVASLKMNVNSTGDKPIKEIYNGAINNLAAVGNIQANATLLFSYDGTNWVLMNNPGYNSSWSTMSLAEAQAGTATNNRVIRADRLRAAINAVVPATTTSDNGKFLRIVNGVPAWVTVSDANGVSF